MNRLMTRRDLLVRAGMGFGAAAASSLLPAAPVNPLAPMGGVKTSGLGREYGLLGLQAYTEPKVLSTWRSPMA